MSQTTSRPTDTVAEDEELERLRRLLIGLDGPEFEALVRTIRDPGSRTSAIAEVISEAVAKRAQSDDSLGDTLAPTIEGALHRSIDRNPEPIANAIYPVIGPSVRKAITSAIADMVGALNRTVELQFSPRALRWRFEAWRAGLSYTEYLFANNINYVIEHAFLFHRETSLLLQHVAADAEFEADSDMVSSMLSAMSTALNDFMTDSFQSDSDAARRSWSVEDHTIFVLAGEFAVVALVTRGTPPASKLAAMSNFLDKAHVAHRESLRNFAGDASVFAALQPQMEDLLRGAANGDEEDDASGPPMWPFAVVAGLVIIATATWAWWNWHLDTEAEAARASLAATPGYLVLDARRTGRALVIEGLRDPLAPEPSAVAAETLRQLTLEPRFRPWFSAEPEIVRQRLLRALDSPSGVDAVIEGRVLVLSGTADAEWRARALALAAASDGIDAVEESGLELVRTAAARLDSLRSRIERARLRFERGESALTDMHREDLAVLVLELRSLFRLASEGEMDLQLTVIGQSDVTGSYAVNQRVSRERAENVRDALVALGLEGDRVRSEPRIIGEMDAQARQVRFEILEREAEER